MKYKEENLRFELKYKNEYVCISENVCFDFDSGRLKQLPLQHSTIFLQVPNRAHQSILEFERPSDAVLELLQYLSLSKYIKYPVVIGPLQGELQIEAIEVTRQVTLAGTFYIGTTVIE